MNNIYATTKIIKAYYYIIKHFTENPMSKYVSEEDNKIWRG